MVESLTTKEHQDMTNLTDKQRLDWVTPKTGLAVVQQELDAILINSSRSLGSLMAEQKDPALQQYLLEQIGAASKALTKTWASANRSRTT